MTSHTLDLDAIKSKHRALKSKFNDPAAQVGCEIELTNSGAHVHQVGLSQVYADDLGRLWVQRLHRGELAFRMIVDPRATEESIKTIRSNSIW